MRYIALAFALLAAGCTTTPSPGSVLPPATPLAGAACDPPTVIPASIIARVRAQFEDGRTEPPPAITPEDAAAYQALQTRQRANDWGNLCYFRTDNAALAAQPAPADRVVFMGDSITQSWLLSNPDFFGPARVNRGISGQTTPQMLLRFKADVLGLKPSAVHILGGVNDIAGNTGPTTLEDVKNNVMSMVELAQAHGVKVILATPLPAAEFSWAPKLKPREAVIQYAAWVRAYAADQNLIVADYFTPLATPDGALRPELTFDGVHPNKKGYAIMEPIAQAAIARALGR